MSATTSSEEWERWKNAIHTLYILENLPLGGPSGVIETMRHRYGFCATKRQYEYRFQQWGLEKNMPGGNYPIIASKLGKRKAAGTESNVFWKGVLVPAAKVRKESSRHGYMTTLEKLVRDREPAAAGSPKTPPGVNICSPPPYPLFRRVFQELPILKLFRSGKSTFSAQPLESNVSTISMGSVLCMPADVESSKPDHMLAAAKSLIPISAFENELVAPASSTVVGNAHDTASSQVFKVVAYLVSNNFPGDCNRTEIHKWLKALYSSNPDIFQSLHGPSNQALLQGLLRLAVEEEDAPMAGALLDAGADPNGNTCVEWPGYYYHPITLTPLQHSCFQGNLELVRQLLRARAQIDHPEFGWCCSPLLFAICGFQLSFYHDFEHPFADQATIRASDDGLEGTLGYQQKGHRLEVLITLVSELLNAGANVNATPGDVLNGKPPFYIADSYHPIYSLTCEKHSALTLSASFRCPELVDFLIRHGAHVSFRIDGARSALRDCLYTSEEHGAMEEDLPVTLICRLEDSGWLRDDPSILSKAVETAQRFIMAGVDVNDHKPCGTGDNCRHGDLECYSALDLGLLAQDENLVNALWSAGSKPSRHSLEIAIKVLQDHDIFSWLLEADAPLPRWAFTDDELQVWLSGSRELSELPKRRIMILAAIRLGACANLESLTTLHDCSTIFDAFDNGDSYDSDDDDCTTSTALTEAIQECCRRGHVNTLACLLRSDILPRGPLAPILGSSLALAISGGHIKMVDILLNEGADVNAPSPGQCFLGMPERAVTPLHLAIESRSRALTQTLIHHGAEAKSQFAGNFLVAAIQHGDRDIIQLLVANASPNEPGRFEFEDKLMVDKPWYRDQVKRCGWLCPLAAAIIKEEWTVMEQLLHRGALSDGPLRLPCLTPLWASVYQRNITVAQWLINKGAEVNDEVALEYAGADEGSDLLELLVEELSTKKRRGKPNVLHVALHAAMKNGHMRNARLVLDSKIVDVHAFSCCRTLLHHALHSPLLYRQEFLRLLLEAGASPDTITDNSTERDRCQVPLTGLLEAIRQRDSGCVRIILGRQAKTDRGGPSKGAYSPLQLAAFEGNSEIVRMLLDRGHNPDLVPPCAEVYEWQKRVEPDKIGTSVQNATMKQHGDILKTLLQHGANPNSATMHCRHTALQIACRDGSLELVELLLEYGADVNAPPAERHGATALQFAAIGGYLGIAHLLLQKEADVNAAPAPFEGRTAFEGAAEHGRVDMVQLLKNAGADTSEAGQGQFERAWERATRNGHLATRALLKSYLS